MGYKTEPDGTRVYDHGHRYKPLADHERKYRRRKPADAEERGPSASPATGTTLSRSSPRKSEGVSLDAPDDEAIGHKLGCLCLMCRTVPRVRKKKRARLLKGG